MEEPLLESFRNWSRRSVREAGEAPDLLAELLRRPPEERLRRILEDPELRRKGLCELLLERCAEAAPGDPQQAVELGELAMAVADRLHPEEYGEATVEDLQALARAWLGNAWRVLSRLDRAEALLDRALAGLQRGSGNPADRGRALELRAHLRADQGRFAEAAELERDAEACYHRVGDPHLQARARVHRARALAFAGESEAALELVRRARPALDRRREPRMVMVAEQLLFFLRGADAEVDPSRLERLARSVGTPLDRLRLRWLEARRRAEDGDAQGAVEELRSVRRDFLAAGIGLDAALVSLELALIHLDAGRRRQGRDAASEALAVLASRRHAPGAVAAVTLLRQALAEEELGGALLRRARSLLARPARQAADAPPRAPSAGDHPDPRRP